jgi:hypothetical protein
MQTDGQAFLEHILFSSRNKFELRFSRIATRLDLGRALDARELSLLYEATFLATLCNLTLNGLGIFSSGGPPERETIRTMLEREFMCARDRFSRCAGLKKLSISQKCSIESVFFKVLVAEENLAA